jgi:hypothetical protein
VLKYYIYNKINYLKIVSKRNKNKLDEWEIEMKKLLKLSPSK